MKSPLARNESEPLQLAEEKRRLVEAQAVAKLGSWEMDLSTLTVNWSPEMHRIFEREPSEFTPTHEAILNCVHPDDRQRAEATFRESIGQASPQTFEHRIVMPDGRIKLVEERWQMYPATDARPARAVGTCWDITERKKIEESVRRNEALLKMASRVGRLGAWQMELPGLQLVWSDEMKAIHEVPPDFIPTPAALIDFYAAEDRPRIRAPFEACLREGRPFDEELQIITRKGNRLWVWTSGEAVRDAAGQIIRVEGTVQDISERKIAEKENRALADRMIETLENISDAFFTVDREWRFTFLNREAERLLNREREKLIGQNVWTEFPAAVGSLFELKYREAMAAQATRTFEEFYPPLDRWFTVKAYPSEQGLAVYFRDNTAARQADEALKTSEARFQLVSKATQDAIWDWDLVKNTLWWNESHTAIFGLNPADANGIHAAWLDRIHPEDAARVAAELKSVIEDTTTVFASEYRIRNKNGVETYVLDRGYIIRDASGKPLRMIGAMTDLTERKQAEEELRRANRALRMLSRCNEALIRARDEPELLVSICQLAIDLGGFRLAWVGYAQDDLAKTIAPQAHAGAKDEYLAEIALSWDEGHPAGKGPAARAIRTLTAVVVPDVQAPASGFVFVREALIRGYRGVVCLPLRHGQKALGVLSLFLADVVALPPAEIGVLQELADNLAFGIINLRAREERQRTHEAVLTMARGISAAIGRDFFQQLMQSLVEALGADAGLVAGYHEGQPELARTLGAAGHGEDWSGFNLATSGLPITNLEPAAVWTVESEAGRRFPESPFLVERRVESFVGTKLVDAEGRSIGLMFVFFGQPLQRPDFVSSSLRIFAARAAAEIERRTADARTQEQAALLDKAQDAILVRDLQHRITFWNQSAERLYGWTKAEVINRSVRELLYFDPGVFDRAMTRLLAQGDWVGELTQVTKTGKNLMIEGHWTLVRREDGTPHSVLAINTDITERKSLEQQFRRAQRMESIGTLAGGIAHDLNNLLAPITMGVDLLRSSQELTGRNIKVLDNIKRSADRGVNLVKQVLSFAREVENAKVPLSIRHVIREVESIMENSFPKNISLESQLAAELPLVEADPTQLNQVLLNLCVNSRDAMPNGGRLVLRALEATVDQQYAAMNRGSTPGRYVVIEVIDTGTGISKTIIDRIFEPFFTTKEFGQGTGLGLATVLGIVRAHGGFVTVYSEPGKGTTFKVYLPAQTGSAEVPADLPPEELLRGSGELVLVVDDEASIREVTRATLESAGYRVVTAEDGADAMCRFADHHAEVALVLTDMMMPVMDGRALILALRRHDPQVEIIAVSGLNANGQVARVAHAGIAHFLTKPYTAGDLLRSIQAVLAKPAREATPSAPA